MQPTSGSSKPRHILLFALRAHARGVRLILRGRTWLVSVVLCCLAVAGCTTPVSVERVAPQVGLPGTDGAMFFTAAEISASRAASC